MEVVAETIAAPAPPAAQPSLEEQPVVPLVQKSASVDLPKPEAVQNEVILCSNHLTHFQWNYSLNSLAY